MDVVFDNVCFTYNRNIPIANEVLKEVSLKMAKNKINAIVGPTGSGKTTLVELINGLSLPTNGRVMVGDFIVDHNIDKHKINLLRYKVGLVFQFPEEQFFQTTVKQELAFGMQYFHHKIKINERISEVLKMVGLNDSFLDRNPFKLSGGEKRRIAIAAILMFDPEIIILDEPTVSLDNGGRKSLINLIRRLKYFYRKTVIVISHDVDMLYQIADFVHILNKGELIASGSKYEVFNDIELLLENNISIPKVAAFTRKVYDKKGLNLGKYYEINDLIKMVYKHVQ
jgi:energy-coupling factor transport system ATP-binding protein